MRIAVLTPFLCLALASTLQADQYALVVGVNDCPKFRLADGSKPHALRGAEADAAAVAQVLVQTLAFPKGNVRTIVGDQADYRTIRQALSEYVRSLRSNDTFVFYFAGHGTQLPDQKPFDEEDGLDEALCLVDCDAAGNNLLVDDELGRWLDDLPAENITVILDCCHAGTGTKDGDDEIAPRYLPFPGVERRGFPTPKWNELKSAIKSPLGRRTALFACAPQQQAYERRMPEQTPPARSGQFTYYLLHGLTSGAADNNSNMTITNAEALAYARSRLEASFNQGRTELNERQEPAIETDDPDVPILGASRK